MEHFTTIQDCFGPEGDYYAPSCTCGWEAFTTDDLPLAIELANSHALTGDMETGQNWEEHL